MTLQEKWKLQRERKAFLALADGSVFYGYSMGAPVDSFGEVVFNTSLSGYQRVSVSNISIRSEEINDCWVYGSYRAKVAVSEKK